MKWSYPLVLVALLGFGCVQSGADEVYFDDSSPVMYFWSAQCHYCQEQKPVLEALAEEGFRVKSMDVAGNPGYWDEYGVRGTPTFLASNGDRLTGLKSESMLRAWFEEHGARITGKGDVK